jgi:hypothetical protein
MGISQTTVATVADVRVEDVRRPVWLDRLLELDSGRVVHAHDAAVWLP